MIAKASKEKKATSIALIAMLVVSSFVVAIPAESVLAKQELSWAEIVEDAQYGWNGLIKLRDRYSPQGLDFVPDYNANTNEVSDTLGFGLLDASLWMYQITGETTYLDQARLVADDIEAYMINDKGIMCSYSRTSGQDCSPPTSNRNAVTAVAKLALLDPHYIPLVEKLADAMIKYEINPSTDIFYQSILPNGDPSVKEMYLPYDGSDGLEALLIAYEATSNEAYLKQAYETIISYWDVRDKGTNLLPSWIYSDTKQVKEYYMQMYGGGIFLKVLLHYYYLTGDDKIYSIIEDYSKAVTTYMWDQDHWNYRTLSNGDVAGLLGNVVEANFPKLDDSLFLLHGLSPSFKGAYEKAKIDYDTTFQEKLILSNNLVKHSVHDDGADFRNHQSAIWHAFPAIQNTAMRLYHDTGDKSYLEELYNHYEAVVNNHKRAYGYIGTIDPYSLENDPYNYNLHPSATGYIANKIVSTIKPSSTVEIVWTTVGNAALDEPFIATYSDTGRFNNVNFKFAEKEFGLNTIIGEGEIAFGDQIESASIDGKVYAKFEGNMLHTMSGQHSYVVKLVSDELIRSSITEKSDLALRLSSIIENGVIEFLIPSFLSALALPTFQLAYAEEPVFGPAKNLSSNPGNANSPMIAVSGNYVYVVWRENNDIYFKASSNNGGTFGSTINLSGNAGTSQSPHIAAFGSNVYVVWQDNTLGNNDIFFKKSSDNGTSFGGLINLSLDGFDSGGALSHLDLAASTIGAYVVWQDDDDLAMTDRDIIFRKVFNNGTLGSKINLSGNAGNSQAPQVTAFDDNAYVVWRDSTPLNFDIFFRASNNTGASFGSTLNLSNNTGSSQAPQIAASGSDVHVVWRDSTPGNFDILFKASNNNGTSFGTEINLSSNAGSSQSPQIDASGSNAYVAWRDDTPGNLDIFFRATNNNGGTFGTAINMSDNIGSSQSPDVEASGGDVYVAWYDSTPGNFDILFRASNDTGGTFGTALNLSNNNTGSSQSPDVEASADEIYAAWYDNTPGNNEILFKSTDDAPTANNQSSVSTNEDTPKIITLTGSDPEVDPLTFMIVTPPLNGTLGPITVVNPTVSNVTYTPDLNFFGTDSFTFKASDGILNSNNATVNIMVNALNDPPTANNQNVTTPEDSGAFVITLTGSDPEGDSFDFSIVNGTNPLNGTLGSITPNTLTSANITYAPDANFFGINTFMFRVNDTATSFSNNATVTINVTAVNDPPVANNDSVTVSEDSVGVFDITVSVVTSVLANDTDVDGDTLTIIDIPTPAQNGTALINGTGTGITYTPLGNFSGTDSFVYEISDGNGGNDTATVSVSVIQINDAPVANNINYTTPEDTPIEINLTGSDEEQSELEFTIVTPPQNGTLGNITQSLSVDDASVVYTPNANFFGTDSFTFMVNDTVALAIDTAAVNITITAVNDPPLAFDDIFTIEGNSAAALDILANDDDDDDGGDGLTIISTSSPSNGNVTITGNGTSVTYTPDLNFIGVDSFDYSINDTNNVVSAASVDVIVEPPETFKVKKGTFAKSTGAAPVVQNITGVGFEPKALILFTTDQSAEGLTDSYNFAMGFSNGTASRTVAVKSDDNAGTSNTGRAFGKNVLRIIGSGDPIIVAQANVIGFNSDGFALNWTSNTSTPSIIHYLALGGVDITDVRVSNFKANTTAVNETVSGVGFQPDFLMFMHAGSGKLAGKAPHGYMSYGFATSPTERAAIAVTSEDNRNLMDTKKWQRTDRAIIALEPNTGAIDAQADLVSMDSDGFTINWIDPPADPDRVYYLAIKGGSYGVGSFNGPAVVGPQPISGVGLQPRGLILTSFGESSSASIRNDNRVSFGAAHATGDGNEGSIWIGDRSLVDTSLTARSSVTTKVIRIATENTFGSTSVIAAEADLESLDADGFTLNWTKAAIRQIIYVVFG